MNLNKVMLIGRLTADPELRTTNSGRSVASFSIATNRYWTNNDGEKQEDTQYHNIVVWGRQAEVANQFLGKGRLVYIEGRLQTRSWEDREGNDRRTTEVVAGNIQFGPRPSGQGGGDSFKSSSADTKSQKGSDENNDKSQDNSSEDIPEIDIDEEGEEIDADDIPF